MSELMVNKQKRPLLLIVMAVIAILFGLATIKEGGAVLFTEKGKMAAGHYVPFVLWFNFLAGFAYILAGIALVKLKACVRRLSVVIALSTVVVFIFFGIHIFNGGAYEVRTIAAMSIRTLLWIFIAIKIRGLKILEANDCHCSSQCATGN